MSIGERDLRDQGERGLDSTVIEQALSRIPSVTAARVVAEPSGRIAEVHLLAGRDRAPKQLVRDVQSVALASFGIEIDYRTVSVVQLEESMLEGKGGASEPPRLALLRLSAEVNGPAVDVRVTLESGDQELIGTARGPASSALRVVARAVVEGISPTLPEAAVEVEFADAVSAGNHTVAIAVLKLATTRGDHAVVGSAIVRKDINDAMARASLSAVNRLLATL